MSDSEPTTTGEDTLPTCGICGCELERVQCPICGGEGDIDVYDDDPMWYEPCDTEPCDMCDGMGGWYECPLAENHWKEKKEEQDANTYHD